MSALNLEVLPGGRYLLRNVVDKASQVVKELGSSLRSQSLVLSVSEKGKSRSLMASPKSDGVGEEPVELDCVTLC